MLEGKNCTLSRLNGRQVGKPETHHMPGTPPSIPGPAAEGAVGHNRHPTWKNQSQFLQISKGELFVSAGGGATQPLWSAE